MRFAILAFCVAVAYGPGLFAAPVSPKWWVIAVGLPLVSPLDPRSMWAPASWCMAGAVVWAAAAIYDAPHPHAAAMDTFFLALLCLTAYGAAGLDDIGPALTGMSWGMAISAVLCVPQWLGWWSPVPQSAAPAGLFYNREVLVEIVAPLFVWALLARRWMLVALLSIPVALCHSRVAIVAIAAALLWAWSPQRRWTKWCVVFLLMTGAIALLAVLGSAKWGTAFERASFWLTAVYSITPLGRGPGWWALSHVGPYEEFVHSDVLQSVVELGAGALLLAVPLIAAWWRGAGSTAERAAYAAITVEALVSFPIHLPAGGFLGFALAGFLARDRGVVCVPGLASRTGQREPAGWTSAHNRAVAQRI
jgi:hypothetical protein